MVARVGWLGFEGDDSVYWGVLGMMGEGNVTWWMDHGCPPAQQMLRGWDFRSRI